VLCWKHLLAGSTSEAGGGTQVDVREFPPLTSKSCIVEIYT
jgi:hypothetical protein